MARWYKTRYGLRRRLFSFKIPGTVVVLGLLVLIAILLFRIVESNLRPTIMSIAENRAHAIAIEAINKALYDKVLANVGYNDLVFLHKDSQQRVTVMQADSVKIARIISQANLEIKENLNNISEEVIRIPLGQALGSEILASYGPRINVTISPIGNVDVKLYDEFQQAGINQVRHILYLKIETNVKIVIPLVSDIVSVTNNIPIAETIIVGQVPDTFLGLDSSLLFQK